MRNKFFLIFYYFLPYNLPCSRFSNLFTKLRSYCINRILGDNAFRIIERRVYISDAKDLVIGEGCEINENVFIQGAHIGRNVLIAPNVSILTTTHNYLDPNIPIKQQGDSSPQVPRIESDVWIGRNAIILPGVIIGQGSVVGAGAIVTKNIEPFSVYGGVPAKFIKKRDKNDCC